MTFSDQIYRQTNSPTKVCHECFKCCESIIIFSHPKYASNKKVCCLFLCAKLIIWRSKHGDIDERGIDSSAKEKHNIKRADRLCSNANLQSELLGIYGGIIRRFVTSNRPFIHVDWPDLDTTKRNFLIRAAVALDGRSITIY